MYYSKTETKWVKFGKVNEIAFVGKDVIAFASDIYISFLHLNTREEKVVKFDNWEKGEGASCLAGHSVVSVFSIAERRSNPRILILTYPKIRRISSCALEKGPNGYLSSTFGGTEYLVTLTSFPDFLMIIWLWRTGEKLTTNKTKITDDLQKIECSVTSPHLVSQLAETSGKLAVYEISICSKIVSLVTVETKSLESKLVSLSWTADGSLVICDETGNVRLMNNDGKALCDIVKSDVNGKTGRIPLVMTFKNGLVLVDSRSRITFYRRPSMDVGHFNETLWIALWMVEAISHPICMATHSHRNGIIFYGEEGDLLEVNVDEHDVPKVEAMCTRGAGFEILDLINPKAEHIITMDKFGWLSIFESLTGQIVGKTCLKKHGRVLCMASHLDLPILALSTDNGKCLFVSVLRVSEPTVLNPFHLHRESLDRIKFSQTGETLGVGNSISGDVFLIGKGADKQTDVLGHLRIGRQIVDFLVYEDECEALKILVLVVTNVRAIVGDKIMVYTMKIRGEAVTGADHAIELPNLFESLHYGPRRDIIEIVGAPYLSKQLHLMEVQQSRNFDKIVLTQALPSAHQLRNIEISTDRHHIVTSSYDGLVIVRSGSDFRKIDGVFMANHRREAGTKCALASPSGELIVSIGRNGNVVATRLSVRELQSNLKDFERFDLNLWNVQRANSSFTRDSVEPEKDAEKTWTEIQEAVNLRREQKRSILVRASIVNDIQKLKDQITKLLDSNEKEPEDVRLPISMFDLDQEARTRRIQKAYEEREEMKRSLEERILRQDEIAEYLKKTFWNPMLVHACCLKSIGRTTQVDNYPLISEEREDSQQWNDITSDLAASRIDSDDSWTLGTILEADDEVRDEEEEERRLVSKSTANIGKIKLVIGTDYSLSKNPAAEREKSIDEDEEQVVLTGTTTHRWIQNEPGPLANQLNQKPGIEKTIVMKKQKHKLKTYFNDLFDEMRNRKERELSLIAQRIERLRYCASELKNMFGVDCSVDELSVLPTWHSTENPETIVKVEDHEVPTVPYVSPREQEILKQETPKSSDFSEEAVTKMMDGNFEVRWEDEIKKDIVKPECMLTKDPADYTEDDLEAVTLYEEKVQALEAERLRYKLLLEADWIETKDTLKKDIDDFDEKLDALFVERTKLDSAILQESLKWLRDRRKEHFRMRGIRETSGLKNNELVAATRRVQDLTDELSSMEMAIVDLKNRYEATYKREKLLEGKFRGEFLDLKQPMMEHLLRHYKRRPRTGQMTCTSVTFLTEIGRCVIGGEKSDILPRECSNFLKVMDSLDIMPNNLPTRIDVDHWNLLCKLRRAKVDMEIKMKCCAVELAEAEQTYSSYQKMKQIAQNRLVHLKDVIREQGLARSRLQNDTEIQLILKMGQIEAKVQGHSDDLKNAVLVPCCELFVANDAIVEAGRVKLAAMNRTIRFRKNIACIEWQHKCMQITLRNLREDLKTLQGVKITREIQEYLTSYPEKASPAKEESLYERNLKSTERRFRKIVDEARTRLERILKVSAHWRKRNVELIDKIDTLKSENRKKELLVHNETLEREEIFAKKKLEAIMKKTRLAKKVQDNYEDLLALQTQLELLRLKTYPTLKAKTTTKRQ